MGIKSKDCIVTQRILNGKSYSAGLSIFSIKAQYDVSILNNMLYEIRIDNDIDSFYPKCSVTFDDTGGKYTNLYSHYGQYMHLIIKPPTSNNQQNKAPYIDMIFLVTNHILLDYNPKALRYKLQGIFCYQLNFSKHLNFATDKDNAQQSPYLLIKNILNNIGITMNHNVPPCTKTIHFISDQNKTAKDYIKYCLMMGVSEDDPPAYLYYHIINHQPVIFNRNFILNQPNYKCNKDLVIPTVKGNKDVDNSLIVYNASVYSTLQSSQFYQDSGLQHRWDYDTSKRQWIKTIFKPQRYQQLLSLDSKTNSKLKTSFDIQQYQQSGIRLYSTNYQYNVYARLHNLQTCTNCISFYVEGNIIRDCGQLVTITCLDNNLKNIYGGTWQVYSVTHLIQGGKYINIINCYRTLQYNFRPNN